MKYLSVLLLSFLLIFGCAGTAVHENSLPIQPVQAEVKITIVQEGNAVAIKAESNGNEKIMRSMDIKNPGLELSHLSAISGNELYVKIFSGLSVADVTRLWNDLIYITTKTDIKIVNMFIDSPGGDAFSGLALADQIQKYQKIHNIKFIAHATGIIASAAVPVFAVCDETHATPATIFMVHEAALWKWPGRESASDIRAQNKLMDLLQRLYLTKMVHASNLTFDQWVALEKATSWFSVKKAKDIGILDFIDGDTTLLKGTVIEME